MLEIAICDDNVYFCTSVKELCASCFARQSDYTLHTFDDGLQLINRNKDYDIIFLDIEMPSISGFEVAEILNSRNTETRIIFLTNHAELMQEAFKVKAFRYLVKPVNKKELKESLADAIKDISSSAKVIVDSCANDCKVDIIVYEKDIVYIEAIGDGAVIYTLNQGNLISRKPLRYWAEILTKAIFFQTHKSYIVSLKYVASLRKSTVTTVNGKDIPVAKRKAAIFKECVGQYIKST